MPAILLLDGARRRLPDEPTWLRRSDWLLRDAATVEEALRTAASDPPALFVVDLEAGAEIALAAVRAFCIDPLLRKIPVLAFAPLAHAREALRAGAAHVFTTDADQGRVLGDIGRLLALLERAAPRVPVDAPVAFWRDGHPTEGRITDLSTSGFFTATNEPHPVGSRLEISFQLPHDRSGKTVTGEVIVVRRADAPASGFGARFFRLPGNALSRIEDFLGAESRMKSEP